MKSIFKSKTFWFNLAGLATVLTNPEVAMMHPGAVGTVITVGNIILRTVTKQPVSILPQ